MMSKKKKINNLEREVKTLKNDLDLTQKAGLVTAGGLAIVSIASLINSALTKKKVKEESDQVADALSDIVNLFEGASVSYVDPETETSKKTSTTTVNENKVEEEESKEDDSKQPKVQLIGSFSGPELQSQLSMLAEFLSMIDFAHEYKFSLQTLKTSCLLFIAETDDNLSISHMEPSYILDGNICGDDGLYFIIYLPDCKIKVAVSDEVVEITEI